MNVAGVPFFISHSDSCIDSRRRADSNRGIKVLQTSPLPLGYGAKKRIADCQFAVADLLTDVW